MSIRDLCFISLCMLGFAAIVGTLLPRERIDSQREQPRVLGDADSFASTLQRVNKEFAESWNEAQVKPAAAADSLTLIRRLSLGLTGILPSLEELRAVDQIPAERRINWWLDRILQDRRTSDYLAERLARSYVGTEEGPFLIFRRRRFVTWLSDQLYENRAYNEIVADLISDTGLWTDSPAVNFLTVTTDVNGDEQPDEKRLAARTARAFLGIRLDCVQCHDDHLQGKWLQQDFHQLAAFFAGAKSSPLGIQDVETQYEYQYLGGEESVEVPTRVPFLKTLDVKHEVARVQLANWVTHPENVAFRRALVNRLWSLMMGKPLIEPIDDIPLNGPLPAGLEALSIDFAENNFNLRRLIRLMASTNVFQLDSRTEGGATLEQEQHWAVFPLTRLRPEQVAGSIQQASSLTTIDAGSHVLIRLARFQEGLDFVERYGDRGEDEYGERAGTIPQRLLMMNGKLVGERTKEDVFNNAVSRIAAFAENDDVAIESAYLCVLTRRPSPSESDFFRERLDGKKGRPRQRELEDLYWSLINSTEFSWNH